MNPFRPTTRRFHMARLRADGMSAEQVIAELTPLVEAQEKPWVFSYAYRGKRVAKPMPAQLVELRDEVNRVFKIMEGN